MRYAIVSCSVVAFACSASLSSPKNEHADPETDSGTDAATSVPPVPSKSCGAPTFPGQSYFVAPDGTPQGDGSVAHPWDIRTAFSKGLTAGSTMWLRGGTYGHGGVDRFDIQLAGTKGLPINGVGADFNQWRSITGFDGDSSFSGSLPTQDAVFARPNIYEPGRGHVIVFNWDGDDHAMVDLSRIMAVGSRYEIRDVQNLAGAPVATGDYQGGLVRVPMDLTAVAPYVGSPAPVATNTAPRFETFLVTSCMP